MAGAANRKKANRLQGWEEAGAEFYQESYPSNDAELHDVLLHRDPKHLATLLPSKQNRAAATIRMRGTDTRTFRRQTSSRSYRDSTRRPSTYTDVQVSMLPDLSEPISNEEATWEKIMQIKELPVPMSQKKEIKAKMQSAPNLRLQGYEQFKWKRKVMWQRLNQTIQATLSKLELWKKDLKRIEGNFGTGVVAYFLFIKWLIVMNILTFIFIFLLIILPTIVFNDEPRQACFTNFTDSEFFNVSFDNCADNYFEQGVDKSFLFIDLVQGTGQMERTLLFYGIYSNSIFRYYAGDSPLYYSLPLAYVSTVAVIFFISLFAIIKAAAKGFKTHLVEGEGQFYQFCNLIFGGWDFCIHNEKSAAMKSNAIFNEIKASLENERLEEERKSRTRKEKIKLVFTRIFINILVLIILTACGGAIYAVFLYSPDLISDENDEVLNLAIEFLPSFIIVCLNIIIPFIFMFLVTFERYSPLFIMKITLARTVFLRLSSLVVLYATLYTIISCELEEGDECVSSRCNTPLCWETFVGQQIYKLTLLNFATQIFITFFINFPRSLIDKHSKSNFAKFIGEQTFDLPRHVLDIVYMQTLCWLGSFYAPMLPLIFVFIYFIMFYVKKFACLVNSKPSTVVYRASRCKSMFMMVLLVSFITAFIPIAYSIAEVHPSRSCGPFRCVSTVWTIVGDSFLSTPIWIQNVTNFLTTAFFAVPVFVILILLIYYYTAVNSANRHMVRVLKEQLVLEGHDKQFLLERLSTFIKQQQEAQKQLRRSEMMREGDRNVSSN